LTKGLDKDVGKALSLGLKYIPTEQKTTDKQIQIDKLIEDIKEKDFMLNNFSKRKREYNPIFKSSNKKRKLENKDISTLTINLTNLLKKELELVCKKTPNKRTTQHYANMAKQLLAKPEIKIVPADKNLGLTAMKLEDYYTLCLTELDDPDSYKWLGKLYEHHILAKMKLLFDTLISDIDMFYLGMSNQEKNFLKIQEIQSYRVPVFHILPKLHKPKIAGRPIIAATNWSATNPSIYLSFYLREFLT
jgi:hypothetical protein